MMPSHLAEGQSVAGARSAAAPLPPCLYCGGDCSDVLFMPVRDRLRHVPGEWAYWRCRQCGSALLAPHPRPGDLAAFYPAVYNFTPAPASGGWGRRLLARLQYHLFFRPQYAAQVRQVLRGVGWTGQARQQLLDVGCGRGLRLLAFRQRGFVVHGMDFQPQVVEYLQKQLAIPAVCTDIDGLPEAYPGASFDVITAFHVLEHVPSVARLLGHCFTLLKPGGWLAAALPLVDSLQARWLGRRWVAATDAPRHLSLPSRAGLRHACRQAGFDSVAFAPDAALNCAGGLVLSLLPSATTTHLYGRNKVQALFTAPLAGLLTLLAVPWILAENYVARRPAFGLVFARKPEE
jgi:SAM-dependent methyltransferase